MNYLNFLNVYKINLLNKKKYFYYKFYKKSKIVATKFIELNLIKSITHTKDKTYKISINYKNNMAICTNIKNMYKISHPIYVNIATLKKLKKLKTNSFYLLFTSTGLITNQQALNHNVGGIIFCKITI